MAQTDQEKLETFERMDMPLLANIYRKRLNKGSSSGSGSPKERKGGLGSNKGAARYKRTSAEERKRINSDGRFGYFDEVNKRYIPAFIDAMDGGGRDTRGDTFEGGGPLSGIANDLGIKPYGSQRERMFGGPTTSPIMQAVANPQSNVDPRVLTSRGYEPDNIAQPAATVMNQQVGISDPLTFQSDQANPATFDQRQSAAQAEQARMAALIDEARGLAARAGLDFNTMPQERQAEFINAVRFGMGGPTSGRF
tara:strand:- start:7 stop:762 length:756 start_codon:yes stop_codon:yes gene_type:complete